MQCCYSLQTFGKLKQIECIATYYEMSQYILIHIIRIQIQIIHINSPGFN